MWKLMLLITAASLLRPCNSFGKSTEYIQLPCFISISAGGNVFQGAITHTKSITKTISLYHDICKLKYAAISSPTNPTKDQADTRISFCIRHPSEEANNFNYNPEHQLWEDLTTGQSLPELIFQSSESPSPASPIPSPAIAPKSVFSSVRGAIPWSEVSSPIFNLNVEN